MIARIHKSMAEKDKGFTLIELLIVIIIIGILAAIAIPVFMNQRQRAVDTGVRSDLRTIATELETYYVDNQAYPATGDINGTGSVSVGDETISLSAEDTVIAYVLVDLNTYTITGTNTRGNDSTSGILYDSAAGGLQEPGSGGNDDDD